MAWAYLINSTLTSSTKGTYRWVLGKVFELDLGDGPSFRGSIAANPYSQHERAELISVARSQNKPWRRSSALAMIALSIGAGCRACELRHVKGGDLAKDGGAIATGDRTVPIKSPWSEILSSLERKDHEFLFHLGAPTRSSKNFTGGFASDLIRDPASPRFQITRARSSFICDRWNDGIPLIELTEITGIREVESLIRYVHLLDRSPKTKAGLRQHFSSGNR